MSPRTKVAEHKLVLSSSKQSADTTITKDFYVLLDNCTPKFKIIQCENVTPATLPESQANATPYFFIYSL